MADNKEAKPIYFTLKDAEKKAGSEEKGRSLFLAVAIAAGVGDLSQHRTLSPIDLSNLSADAKKAVDDLLK